MVEREAEKMSKSKGKGDDKQIDLQKQALELETEKVEMERLDKAFKQQLDLAKLKSHEEEEGGRGDTLQRLGQFSGAAGAALTATGTLVPSMASIFVPTGAALGVASGAAICAGLASGPGKKKKPRSPKPTLRPTSSDGGA